MTPEDREFLKQLHDCTLPEDRFGHEGHLRMAWLELNRSPLPDALVRIASVIRRYATAMGASSKYHATVTVAFTRIVASRMRPGETFADFAGNNADLFSKQPLLARYYSDELLNSAEARRTFVDPDLDALPGND